MEHIKKVEILLAFLLLIVVACMKVKNKNVIEKSQVAEVTTEEADETSVWEKGYDLPVDPKEAAEAEKECTEIAAYVERFLQENGEPDLSIREISNKAEEVIIDAVDEKGYPVRGTGVYREFYNYEKLESFLQNAEISQAQEVIIYELHSEAGFAREKFYYDGFDMYQLFTNVSWSNEGEPQIISSTFCRIKDWSYTEKGWFCYEMCVPEPLDVTEIINGDMMMQVRPEDEKFKEIAEKYLLPIGYQGNNLFCSEWNENHMEDVDYNGLFEYFYAMRYGERIDQNKYAAGISEGEFEEMMQNYLILTSEQLEKYAVYDKEQKVFAWTRLGCGNYAPNAFGTSIPKITDMKTNEDGTVSIVVDAVCEMAGTDKIFSHELTVRFSEDGGILYLRNHILVPGLENVTAYQYRFRRE